MKKLLLVVMLVLFPLSVRAVEIKFSWLPVTGEITGYKIHYGLSSGTYTQSVDVGNPGIVDGRVVGTVSGIPYGTEYFYACTAYNPGAESTYSNEVQYTAEWPIPDSPGNFSVDKVVIININ